MLSVVAGILLVVAYNVMCSYVLIAKPRMVEERFRPSSSEGFCTSTPFFLHSIAAFHVYVAALTLTSIWMSRGTRRWIALCNMALNLYDAVSQYLYWGAIVWTNADQISVDVGVPAVIAAIAMSRGNREERCVAITFDDGAHRTRTPQLLDILKKHGVVATFFVQGQYVNTPYGLPIVQRMMQEGHEVAHHSWNHPQLSRQDAIQKASGSAPRTIRPPYGATNPVLNRKFINQWNLRTVLWDVDPEDWKPGATAQQIANDWATKAQNGSILLAHDIHQVTIDAMDSAISQLKARGFCFKTADRLLGFRQ